MTATPAQSSKGRVRRVGRVVADIVMANRVDEALVERGMLEPERVRRVVLRDVLVDTGATTLCLPIDVIRTLGLTLRKTVRLSTATGFHDAGIYQDVGLTVEGRGGTFDCVELPQGSAPLLGQIPLEWLGLEPDLQNQRLRLLPESGRGGYLFV